MSEKFSLKWNDFHSNVSSSFSALRNEDYLHDVTLVTDDDHHVSAHKLVLSACSDYFKSIFKKSKHANPLLCLDGINSKDVSNVLDYVYNGEVQIYQEDLDHFLMIAEKFKLQGLLSSQDQEDPEAKLKDETPFNEPVPQPENTRDSNKKLPVVRTVSTTSQSISKISIPNEELERLDERIVEQIERIPDGQFRCRMCGKTTKQKINIKNHIETHFDGLSFPCPLCPTVSRSRNSFAMHKSSYV